MQNLRKYNDLETAVPITNRKMVRAYKISIFILTCAVIILGVQYIHLNNINYFKNVQYNFKKILNYRNTGSFEAQDEFMNNYTFIKIGNQYFTDKYFDNIGRFKLPNGKDWLNGTVKFALYPNENNNSDDRILSQMRFVPTKIAEKKVIPKIKNILLYNGLQDIWEPLFVDKCAVPYCNITIDRKYATTADVIIWSHKFNEPSHIRPKNQIWAVRFLESPHHTHDYSDYFSKNENTHMNWTITYRHDSTIPFPYYKYIPYDLTKPEPKRYPSSNRNYASGKSKLAAMFTSNCAMTPNKRLNVLRDIQKYMKVDVYGGCGNLYCPSVMCFELLNRDYKFYFAFENSNCRDYITEKLFSNGLKNNVIPIVMGAHPDDYKRVAPPHSYIHIEDFKTTKELVDYMKYLDKNDTAYNEYFNWKGHGVMVKTPYTWCRICMMAHEVENHVFVYKNVRRWWRGDAEKPICIGDKRWKS